MASQFWATAALALSVVAFILSVIGAATPLWVWLEHEGEYMGRGLFYRIGWDDDTVRVIPAGFQAISYKDVSTVDTRHWDAIAGLIILSCILSGILVLLLFYYLYLIRRMLTVNTLHQLVFYLSILVWACNLIGLLVFCMYHGDALTKAHELQGSSFSWSFIFCLMAAVVGIILTMILALKLKTQYFNAIPAAADPRMAQYASMKTAMENPVFHLPAYSNGPPTILENDDLRRPIQPLAIMSPEDPKPPPELVKVEYYKNVDESRLPVQEALPRQSIVDIRRPRAIANGGHGTRGFNYARPSDLQRKLSRTNFLERRDQGLEGNILDEDEYLESRLALPRRSYDDGDILVTTKNGDIYRDSRRYLGRTSRLEDAGEPIVLSPANFSSSNVKYNHSLMYRPYSEAPY